MALENDPSSRMQLLSLGELQHPGQCCVCGSGNSEQGYISLGVFYDYEGHMYLCNECVREAGNQAGLFTPEEVLQSHTIATNLSEVNEQLTKELADANELVAAFNNLINARIIAVPTSDPVSDPVGEEPESGTTDSVDVIEAPDAGKPASKKSTNGSGRGNTTRTEPSDRKFT